MAKYYFVENVVAKNLVVAQDEYSPRFFRTCQEVVFYLNWPNVTPNSICSPSVVLYFHRGLFFFSQLSYRPFQVLSSDPTNRLHSRIYMTNFFLANSSNFSFNIMSETRTLRSASFENHKFRVSMRWQDKIWKSWLKLR